MKAVERQEMWMKKGQEMERENTEHERKRAESAELRLSEKDREIEYWKNLALGIG